VQGNLELIAPTVNAVGIVQQVVNQPHIQAMIFGEIALYAVAAALIVAALGALAFKLPQAGQAIRRNFPRFNRRFLKIHPLPQTRSAFHVPAE